MDSGAGDNSVPPRTEPADLAKARGTGAAETSLLRVWRSAEARWVLAGSALFGIMFSYPILLRLTQPSEQNDWDFESQLMWAPYYTVVHFHQFPLWNPWKCGGMAMLGNPQSRFVTPFFLLHLLCGFMVGAHLDVTLHLAIAWAGGYVLARVIGLGPIAAVAMATIFPASSWFPLHIGEGQIHLMSFAYLPWIIALLLIASDRGLAVPAVFAGLLLALTFGEGGAEVLIYSAPLVAILAVAEAVRQRSLRPILFLAIAGIFAVGFAAVKLLPVVEVLRERGRVPWGPAWVMWHDLPRIFFARNQEEIALQNRFFIEFGNYISPAYVILAVVGLLAGRRRAVPWVLAGWVLFLFIRGDNCAVPLYRWLRELPLASMLRLSSRFLIPFTLCVAVLAALGVDSAIRPFGGTGKAAAIVLLAVGTVDSLLVGTPFLRHAYDRIPSHFAYSKNFRQFAGRDVFDQTVVSQANMGFVHCYEYTPWKTNVIAYSENGYRGEQYMIGPGSVRLFQWTPNRLRYEVDSSAPSIMVVNQNYEPGWSLRGGTGTVTDENGLLAIAIPPGRQSILLVYRPWSFLLGAAISLLSLLGAVALLWLGRNASHVTHDAGASYTNMDRSRP
jgi:hypothetical protein